MRRLRLLLAAMLLSASLPLAAQTLKIMVEDAASPWSNPDGSGYANFIVREAFQSQGIDIELQVVPYARCKASVQSGESVACFNMAWEPSLQDQVIFADQPLYTSEARVFSSSSRSGGAPHSLAAIPAGSSIGLVNGYEYPPALMAAISRLTIDYSNNETTLLRKLALRRIRYAVLVTDPKKQAAQLIAQAGILPGQVRYLFTAGSQGVYIGFSVRHPDGEFARQQFNDGMSKIGSHIQQLLLRDIPATSQAR
ncbi:substrate-binding periplasmic protein [Vogesella oryzae]|uniref:substrate-binding periplasmic protein n=1 Tax=Vogesella oryzae TaxID=1735285 RepID=UPI001581AED4|nr:hypothetical protein [Vogesella oryzae]